MRSFCLIALIGMAACGLTPSARAADPPSARDLTRAPMIDSVSLSPDGKHLAALTSPDGEVVDVAIWSTDALAKPPVRVRSTHMRFLGVEFLKNDRLLIFVEQPLTIEGTPTNIVKAYVTDLEGKSFDPLLPEHSVSSNLEDSYDQLAGSTLISALPHDPKNVLVEDHRLGTAGDIYSVDVYAMSAARVMKGSEKYFAYQVDLKGDLRARQYADFDKGAMFIAQEYRDPATGQWIELFRSYAKNRNNIGIVGFTTDPNVILISSTEGGDKVGFYEYDVKQKKIIEPAFQHKLFDAESVVQSTGADGVSERILGFGYSAERERIYWLDPNFDALAKSLDKALGVSTTTVDWTDPGTGVKSTLAVESGADVEFAAHSRDFKTVVVEKSGPRQPPEYYLLAGGKLTLLGKARPWIDPSTLGDTTLVEYPARDGLQIPAFLTLPPKDKFGPGPYPTLIEPHGGPWARDDMGWDITGWIQYFASRGYAVLQPQFRGSRGWGDKLWRAGDAQWGLKMQDDNDDAVKWLIGQHIADPKRVAIFGYSYGGYAALAATIRPNGLYQCAISGAGAGDLAAIEQATSDNRYEREYQHPAIGGLDALAQAKDAKIPVLLYHGDHDTTVDPEESRKFAAAVRAAGKPVKLVEIKDMGHQYLFMTPDMMLEQLNIIDAFLKTDCKPGGL